MAEQDPNDTTPGQQPESEPARPRSLTPEQRRLLGQRRPLKERTEGEARSREEEPPGRSESERPEPVRPATPDAPARERPRRESSPESDFKKSVPAPASERTALPESEAGERKTAAPVAAAAAAQSSSRSSEMQTAALIIGAILLVALTFYVGKKFEYWKYLLMSSRNKPTMTETEPDRFPGVSSETLIEQGLEAQHYGRWKDAADRFIAAKRKNLQYRGLLFRVAKMAYDNEDFTSADQLFERSISFGENVDESNYLRGLIALRGHNYSSAEHYFELAAAADPFVAQYYFNWAEALRLDHHPKEAAPLYEKAGRRALTDADAVIFRFKARVAQLEAGDTSGISSEIERLGNNGPLSVDWLMTAAALKVQQGNISEAVRLITDARAEPRPAIFASCAADMIFQQAGEKNPELAAACKTDTDAKFAPPMAAGP